MNVNILKWLNIFFAFEKCSYSICEKNFLLKFFTKKNIFKFILKIYFSNHSNDFKNTIKHTILQRNICKKTIVFNF